MAESVVHMGENSPEQVAYKLMRQIASLEKKGLDSPNSPANREYIIHTYCMCLKAVQQPGYPADALKLGQPEAQ